MTPPFRDLERPGRRLCGEPWPEVKRQGPRVYRVLDQEGNVTMLEATSLGTAMMIAEERLGIHADLLHISPVSGGPEIM
ncbi:hypothetical protein [Synechococcus sp. CS-1328]|uniref:hypothetical protein n=1 Tax=Synechococcus sp. CS-1328 TaxID=2847976 RepID=UPI00223BC842|nr:hypothetical protein [Synechococcus sp. CS-1328]